MCSVNFEAKVLICRVFSFEFLLFSAETMLLFLIMLTCLYIISNCFRIYCIMCLPFRKIALVVHDNNMIRTYWSEILFWNIAGTNMVVQLDFVFHDSL
jgi:hypothetical protein